MKINDTGLTNTSSVKVETRLRSFAFVVSAPNAANFAAFMTAYNACTIEIIKQTASGTEQMVPVRKLTEIFEVFAADTGAIVVTSNGTATTVRASIEMSDLGTIELGMNEYFKINLVGIPTGHTIDIYACDAQVDAQGWHNVVEVVSVDANTPKNILVPNTKMLALPIATTTRCELNYLNGRVVTLESEELKSFCYETNENAVNENGLTITGFQNYYVLNIADARTAKVTCSGISTILKIDFKQI